MGQNRVKAIDIVCNIQTPEILRMRPGWTETFQRDKVKVPEETRRGISLERMLEKMDTVGIEKAFLVAAKAGSPGHPANFQIPYEEVAKAVKRYPDRFCGLAGIDPNEGMGGVRELERAIKELGFVGAHLYPHWFEMPPDVAKYYPFYTKCAELGIPIEIQVGHCLRYSDERPLPSVGRPITLDRIACDFPELKLIGIHMGYPWVEEMISVAWKHPNVYVSGDAYAPKYWPESFVHFINSWGQDKVLFGTDFPVVDMERAIREIRDLNLRPEAERKFLWENTQRVFNLC